MFFLNIRGSEKKENPKAGEGHAGGQKVETKDNIGRHAAQITHMYVCARLKHALHAVYAQPEYAEMITSVVLESNTN